MTLTYAESDAPLTLDLWSRVSEEPEPDPEIPKGDERGPMAPWMILPLINVYRPGGPAYLWLRLVPDDDLKPEEYKQDSVGHRPKWLDDGISDTGIEGIVQHGDWKPDTGSWFYWALTHGIGPGQPFCVELYPPNWSKCSYWDDDWECEWTWDVVRVMPQKDSARSWDEYMKAGLRIEERNTRAYKQAIKELTYKRERDHSALYLDWSSHDKERGSKLHRVELRTRHIRHDRGYTLPDAMAYGESLFSSEDAFEDLVSRMAQTELGKPRTNWDLLRQHPIKPYISERLLRNLLRPWQRLSNKRKCAHCGKGAGFAEAAKAVHCPQCEQGVF